MNAINKCYEHCKTRTKDRYKFFLPRGLFDTISSDIKLGKKIGVNIRLFTDVSAKHNQHWLVFYKDRYFWVVYDTFVNSLITFMPMDDLVNHKYRMSRGTVKHLEGLGLIE